MKATSRFIWMINISRPLFWLFALVYLAGFYESGARISIPFLLQFFSYTFPIWFFGNGINDIYDYQSDRINPRKTDRWSISGKVLEPWHHPYIYQASMTAGLIVFLISLTTTNPINIALTGLVLVFSYFYSAPPLRLKNYPPMDLVANLLGFIVFYLNGYTFGNPTLTDLPIASKINMFTWSLGVLGFVTLGNMMDYESDKRAGTKNSVVRFGMRANAVFVFLCYLAASGFVQLDDFKPLLYYIYFITFMYFTLILKPVERYARFLLFFTVATYAPVLGWYVLYLMKR